MYQYNDPASLPIQPVETRAGGWLHVSLDFPGRTILLRMWRAQVGRVATYLLDSNDPMSSPVDRGITGDLYGGGEELRLMQEIVLGVCGWRALEAMDLDVDVCHLNEGYAAFLVLERARCGGRGARRRRAFMSTILLSSRSGRAISWSRSE